MTEYTQSQLRELETFGCDLGDKKSHLFGIRPDETTWRPSAMPTTHEGFRRFFEGRCRCHVVIEVGTHSRWISALLEQLGHVVTVANPRKVKLISQGTKKCDEGDAELLARLGRSDVKLLSPIKHRGEQAQADLGLLKVRDELVQCRTKLVNQARGLSKSFGVRLSKCAAECFHKKTKEEVPAALLPALSPLYAALEGLAAQVKATEQQIEQIAQRYPDVELVSQPKGVGTLTALAYILTIEDKKRFAKSREAGPFIGLKPGKSQSGESDPDLPITKTGNDLLRRLLVQCAHYILGPFGEDSDLRRWGLALCQRGGKAAKKRARVAVARKLAVLMHRLWVTGEVYEPLGYHERTTKQSAANKPTRAA